MSGQFRLVHIGVAMAMAVAAVTAVGLVQIAGAAGNGTASVFVPIVPCRLVDTRSASVVGARSTPLGAAEVATFAVWGVNGNCSITTNATGIATNITAVNPTATSYVTVYPADADRRPTASNLNVVAGSAPTPNQVTVGLSASGAVSAYNNGGSLDLVIDIVGYYQLATTGSGLPGPPGPPGPSGLAPTETIVYTGYDAAIDKSDGTVNHSLGCISVTSGGAHLGFDLPVGATITSVTVQYLDNNSAPQADLLFLLYVANPGVSDTQVSAPLSSINGAMSGTLSLTSTLKISPLSRPYVFIQSADVGLFFCGATVTYTR